MEFIKDWAFSVCIAYLVSGIVLTVLPENSSKNAVKMVVSVFTLIVIISPLLNLPHIRYASKMAGSASDYAAFELVAKQASVIARTELETKIKSETGIPIKVKNINFFNDKSVIKCSGVVIEINIENNGQAIDLKNNIATKLGINKKLVKIEEVHK